MDIAAIIVNYRTAEATARNVTVLLSELQGFQDPLVVVVDNDSRDGSSEHLRQAFEGSEFRHRVLLVDSGHNGGYGFGINVALRRLMTLPTPPRYIYVINPDAIAGAGAVRRLTDFMDAHPRAGLVGSLVQSPDGHVQTSAFRFPSLWSELEGAARLGALTRLLRRHVVALPVDEVSEESREVDWVSGASMLFRREVIETAGLFDEGFFLYFEEIDFARRVRQAGWKIYFVAGASISHVGSLATGMSDETRAMPRYWFEARRRYLVKHHGRLYGAGCDMAWLCGNLLYATKSTLLRRPLSQRPRLLRDFLEFSLKNVWKPAP